ncbi:MAG TPA: M20/M25/M40 family metallo-hydrolase, partial [Gammaproteobacteria bacterium]|nr:M20/M25/M40 family metallo-hydrolase [Gammaproteobacteria bacterium]
MLKTMFSDKLPTFLAFLLHYTVQGSIFSMKITLVISALNTGGAERVITTLANAWAEQDENVSLITFQEPGYQSFYPLNPGVNLRNLNLRVKNRFYYKKFNENPQHLCFAGHIDVVPVGDGWSIDPFAAEVVDGVISARGAQDMKSGDAAFLYACKHAKNFDGTSSILMTSDEEGEGT